MLNNIITAIVITVLICLVIFAYFGGLWQNKDKIHQAELDRMQMKMMRDSLKNIVAYRDSLKQIMQTQVMIYKNEADNLRDQVNELETKRKTEQLTVRRLRKKEDLQNKFIQTFPEIANSDWGITEVYNEEYDVSIDYLLIPLWFSETFIIDHQNALSWQQQKDKLLMVDSLNTYVIILKDSINVLEKANRDAYERGFRIAYVKYDSLTNEYIACLKKGRFDWKWTTMAIITGGAVGYCILKE